jgi:hypothetical protein
MAAVFHNDVFDAALEELATATQVTVGTGTAPSTYAASYTGELGTYTLTAGTAGADWNLAEGDTSGRKLTLTQQTGNNGTATGTADWLAFDDGVTLLGVIDGDGDTVNSGSPFTINAVDVLEIRDPA